MPYPIVPNAYGTSDNYVYERTHLFTTGGSPDQTLPAQVGWRCQLAVDN